MRIGGIASGMDTDSLIRDLMKANRLPLDKITQKKSYLEWQVNDYRAVNRQLFDFSQSTFDKMILTDSFTPKNVNVSSPDDVAIKNMGSMSDFSGTLKIKQMAKNATMTSDINDKQRKFAKEADMSKKLSELGITGEQSITIEAINEKGELAEQTVTFDPAKETLQSVLNKINKETGVNAFYDSHTGKFSVTAKHSGKGPDLEGYEIKMSGSFAEIMQVNGTNTQWANSANNAGTKGQNAQFTFNGLETERTTNTFQINGFEISLKQVTGDKEVTFNSAPDTEKIFDNIVKYVDEYNKLIEDLHKQIREPKNRAFQPLSDEEKKDMSEKEIEQWEEKAKSGTLRNDSTISTMLTEMRSALIGTIEKGGLSLQDIGISTSKDYLANGKLVIDEATLKKSINEDPNKVHELFSKSGDTIEEQGFARRLRTIVDNSQKVIASKAGRVGDGNDTFTLGRDLKDMNKQIVRFEDRMKMVEDRLWRQFTAMEQAINRANAQSAQLMSSLGGGA